MKHTAVLDNIVISCTAVLFVLNVVGGACSIAALQSGVFAVNLSCVMLYAIITVLPLLLPLSNSKAPLYFRISL